MDASTQTIEFVVKKHFSQQTGEKGQWDGQEVREKIEEVKNIKRSEGMNKEKKSKTTTNQTQTIAWKKNKGCQTSIWKLIPVEIGENKRSSKKAVEKLISRHQSFNKIFAAFEMPILLSPIHDKPEVTIIDDKPEMKEPDWTKWKANEFHWNEENIKPAVNQGKEIQNKRKREENETKKIIKKHKIMPKLHKKDLDTLKNKNWINDEVINSYFELITEKEGIKKGYRTYAMNSFFFPRVHIDGHKKVKRWTKKVNIFNYDMILVPVHLGKHWCLAVIDMTSKIIKYYDSLMGNNTRYLETLINYLEEEAKEKGVPSFKKEEWTLVSKMDIPRQTNGFDCGVFTCAFAEYEAANRAIDFTQADMPEIRRRIIIELEQQKLIN